MTNEIVKNQHILPNKSIERFGRANGMVEVYRIKEKALFFVKPKNEIFCVNRIWDQRSEQGYGKNIEDRYQNLVDRILVSGSKFLSVDDNEVISEFLALWCMRAGIETYCATMQTKVNGIDENILTEEQKLSLELKHMIYVDGGEIPKRFLHGLTMQMEIDRFIMDNPRLTWGIAESKNLEFLVSDNPIGERVIPFTPTQCFIESTKNIHLNDDQMRQLNIRAVFRSKSFYFARNLNLCLYV